MIKKPARTLITPFSTVIPAARYELHLPNFNYKFLIACAAQRPNQASCLNQASYNKVELDWSWHTNLKNCRKDLKGSIRRKTLEKRRKIACPGAWRAFLSTKIIS